MRAFMFYTEIATADNPPKMIDPIWQGFIHKTPRSLATVSLKNVARNAQTARACAPSEGLCVDIGVDGLPRLGPVT